MKRTQVLSYGGGTQTVAMIVLCLTGRIPMPDMLLMADTSRERSSTFDYLSEMVQPALERIGKRVEIASHELATVDLHSGNGDLLVPVYTATGKLPTFCSTEWKERVVQRYLRQAGVNNADCWIGYSQDEAERANRKDSMQWYKRRYPLLEKGISRADCRLIIEEYGWPLPPKSSCYMCPNQSDGAWLEMKRDYPADFRQAIELEKEFQQWDGEVFLHSARIPLADVVFDPTRHKAKEGAYQCSFGCFI